MVNDFCKCLRDYNFIAMSYPFQITSPEQYQADYQKSVSEPEKFWADIASHFEWRKKWAKVLEWSFNEPDVKWFLNGKLNSQTDIAQHMKQTTFYHTWIAPDDYKY